MLCCSPHSGNSFRNSSSGRNNSRSATAVYSRRRPPHNRHNGGPVASRMERGNTEFCLEDEIFLEKDHADY